jgi:hypothetical protein
MVYIINNIGNIQITYPKLLHPPDWGLAVIPHLHHGYSDRFVKDHINQINLKMK